MIGFSSIQDPDVISGRPKITCRILQAVLTITETGMATNSTEKVTTDDAMNRNNFIYKIVNDWCLLYSGAHCAG